MRNTVAGGIILLDCMAAWMLSGSPLPLGLSLVIAAIRFAAKFFKLPIGCLYSFSVAGSFACVQWYLFQTEQAFVVLSDLPGLFHAGMAFHWLFWLSGGDDRKERSSETAVFWMALAGSAMIFWSAGSVENIETPFWLVRLMLIIPVVLIISGKLLHQRKTGWISLVTISAITLTLGQASVLTELGVRQFIELLQSNSGDEALEQYQRDPLFDSTSRSDGTDSRELAKRADISFTHKVRFYAQTDDSPTFINWMQKPVYVRTSALAVFLSDSKIGPLRKGEWHYDSDDGTIDSSTQIATGDRGDTFLYSMLIHRSDVTQLPLITGTRNVKAESVYEFAEGWYQLSADEEIEWLRFRAETVSEYSIFPEKNSSWITSSIFPAPMKSPYLALPKTSLGERIRTQTRILLKDLPPEEHPQAIAGFLRGNCSYSLRYLNPANLPPLENFLFSERKGHCELFATATVLMLRSAGIPSRIAYGYAGGQADSKSKMIAFRDSDFHSWAEILLADGQTWAVFDTTPVNPNSARRAPVEGNLGKVDMSRYEEIGTPGYLPTDEGVFTGTRLDDLLEWMSLHFFELISALPVLAFFFYLFRKWKSRKSGKAGLVQINGISTFVSTAAVEFTFVDAIFELGRKYGFSKANGQTLAEFADRLRSNGIGSPDLFDAVDYAYRVRYANGNRNTGTEKNFLRSIRKLISTAS